ncbi:MAG: DNA repair protein RecO [Gammaproteobacteria bacterium]|nr:DNA repair protein RecO [Gammaproteobacteria bacterium]
MSGAHHFQDQAYVLHSRPYRNSSLIIDVFTREHGRLSLVAKGAKRGNAPLSSKLQPYAPLFLEWGGQNELMTLYKAETDTHTIKPLTGDALYHGFYLNELLLRLLHRHDAHPELFDDYAYCLQTLVDSEHRDIPLRYFELQLLESLGYAVNLLEELHTEADVTPEGQYCYLIEQGPVQATEVAAESLRISGETLLALAHRTLSHTRQRNEAKLLMRSILDHYLGDRPLKARELMQSRKLLRNSTPRQG